MEAQQQLHKTIADPERGILLTAQTQPISHWWCLTITLACAGCGKFDPRNTQTFFYSMN